MGIILYSEILCQTRLSIAMGSPRPAAMSRHHRNLSRGGWSLVSLSAHSHTQPRSPEILYKKIKFSGGFCPSFHGPMSDFRSCDSAG